MNPTKRVIWRCQSAMIEREESFQNVNGITIFYREWLPNAGRAQGIVLIVHGLGEHSGRYRHVAEALTEVGFVCFGIDQLGHGNSGGTRVLIPDLRLAVDDLRHLFDIVAHLHPQLPVFSFWAQYGLADRTGICPALSWSFEWDRSQWYRHQC